MTTRSQKHKGSGRVSSPKRKAMSREACVSLGRVIRRHRTALGVSQEEFADLVAMHRTYYSAIERGEKNMTIQTLLSVSLHLEVSMGRMFTEAGL